MLQGYSCEFGQNGAARAWQSITWQGSVRAVLGRLPCACVVMTTPSASLRQSEGLTGASVVTSYV